MVRSGLRLGSRDTSPISSFIQMFPRVRQSGPKHSCVFERSAPSAPLMGTGGRAENLRARASAGSKAEYHEGNCHARGAGFIGSNLCENLLRAGYFVTCLDNFSTGSKDNIAHLEGNPNFRVVPGDVRSTIRIDADLIYNLACPASPPKYQADPIFTTETCVLGAINVLELARRTGARVLHASTSEIYGEPQCSPQIETYHGNVNSWGPRACYDEGKRCAEALFYDYSRQFGIDVRVVRIFNTYGPRMDACDGRVVSNFIVQALSRSPLTIYQWERNTVSLLYR